MDVAAVSVAIGVIIGTTSCPWILSLGGGNVAADERYGRRQKLIEDTLSGFVIGMFAFLPVVAMDLLQGRNPL